MPRIPAPTSLPVHAETPQTAPPEGRRPRPRWERPRILRKRSVSTAILYSGTTGDGGGFVGH